MPYLVEDLSLNEDFEENKKVSISFRWRTGGLPGVEATDMFGSCRGEVVGILFFFLSAAYL